VVKSLRYKEKIKVKEKKDERHELEELDFDELDFEGIDEI